jgi:hypothetical protein
MTLCYLLAPHPRGQFLRTATAKSGAILGQISRIHRGCKITPDAVSQQLPSVFLPGRRSQIVHRSKFQIKAVKLGPLAKKNPRVLARGLIFVP